MSDERKTGAPVAVELSLDQAFVLFDWLSRFNNDDSVEFDDQAEQRVLWDIEATLEKTLVEPLQDDYKTRLEQARAAVRDREE